MNDRPTLKAEPFPLFRRQALHPAGRDPAALGRPSILLAAATIRLPLPALKRLLDAGRAVPGCLALLHS